MDVMITHKQYQDVVNLLGAVLRGYGYDPGSSDLDNEQPIHVCMPLGEYRRAMRMCVDFTKDVKSEYPQSISVDNK